MARRNRALYFCNTTKLAREIIGGDKKLECKISTDDIERHFQKVYSKDERLAGPSTLPGPTNLNRSKEGKFSIDDPFYDYIEATELLKAMSRSGQRSSAGPDRVSVSLLRRYDPNLVVLTIVANACLCAGYMPNAWREHHSVLLPKAAKIWCNGVLQTDAAMKLDNWRPITISSIMARIVHKVILARMTKAYKFRSNQSAFTDSAIGANVECIRSMLAYCNARKQRHFLAFLDIKSAFDFLDHQALFDALDKAGCPQFVLRYLASSYDACNTVFKTHNGRTRKLCIERGVKQGDPLSSFLFAFAIDATLAKLDPERHGFVHEQIRMSHIAYADDIVLFGNTAAKVNAAIELLTNGLKPFGLSFRASKCQSFGKMFVDGCSRIIPSSFANVNGEMIPIMTMEQPVMYLGCDPIQGSSVGQIEGEMVRIGKLLKSAALSPLQIAHLFNDYVLPRWTFHIAKSRICLSDVARMEARVRTEMKKLLRLPKYLSNGFFHLPLSQGGMGFRSLLDAVLTERHNDVLAFAREYPVLARWAESLKTIQKLEQTCRPDYDSTKTYRQNRIIQLKEAWKACTTQSQGWHYLTDVTPPSELLTFRYRKGTLWQYLQQVRLRTGLLPTRTILNRQTTGHARNESCRHCGKDRETPLHALNQCLYVKPAMIRRHDAVQRRLTYALRKRHEGKCVIEETPRYTTPSGVVLIPDLVTYFPRTRKAAILDVAVCYETNKHCFADVAQIKLKRYEPLRAVIADKYKLDVNDVVCQAAVVGSRGSTTRALIQTLKYYDLGQRTAANMCQTAAEQSIAVFSYFQERSLSRTSGAQAECHEKETS